jgi:uncharacterized protein YjfI (DUF2170 family)
MTKLEFQEWLASFPEDDNKNIAVNCIPFHAKVTDLSMINGVHSKQVVIETILEPVNEKQNDLEF